ncbi:ribonuclease III [Candidatus Zinderia endosymbiont of Aphrophora alni]|uniref:ribonuclease III n=1 Tax=Candidatus Zinderia endosymbiont of Aphrophora alni TaxID=3077951 RepID=UPI0030CF0491
MLLFTLQNRIKYFFKNIKLLKISLIHSSYNIINNERLEFLGDSILNFVMTHFLFEKFKEKNEGSLSYFRSYLINKKTLYKIALKINLANFLYLGGSEIQIGGKFKISVLSNTLEALFGAIFLDSNFLSTKRVIFFLYKLFIKNFNKKFFLYKDFKTKLQEFLQRNKYLLPTYKIIKISGLIHCLKFNVECFISDLNIKTYGKGKNKQNSEQEAAKIAFKKIKKIFK